MQHNTESFSFYWTVQTYNTKHEEAYTYEQLTAESGDIVRAAFLQGGIECGLTAAASLTAQWLVRESVWCVTAALSLSVLDTVVEDARAILGLVECGLGRRLCWVVAELWVDYAAGKEQVEHSQGEEAFDFAGAVGTESAVGDSLNWVESVAVGHQVGLTGTGAWQEELGPWNARVITGERYNVQHAAVVTVGELLAQVVDAVDWLAVTSTVIILKVAPAGVLVDLVKVLRSHQIGDSTVHLLTALDQTAYVSVNHGLKVALHALEPGQRRTGQKTRNDNLHLVSECCCMLIH